MLDYQPRLIDDLDEAPTGSQSVVPHDGKKIWLGELFCGAGGMALGASRATYMGYRFEHAWATDIDADSCRTIQQVIAPNRIKRQDIRKADLTDDFYKGIDGLVFGFPCNDFSSVGERRGLSGEYGQLYRFGVNALQVLKPTFFVAENVSGLSSVNRHSDFQKILRELEDAGYNVKENLYKFEEFGIPQKRHRYFIVGFRRELGISFSHPKPNGQKIRTARQALEGLAPETSNNERTTQSQRVMERLTWIKPGENTFTAYMPDHLRLNMRSGATISQIYRRLMPDEPSYTVTGSGGGGTHLYHWDEPRALTNRERARLQAFPDTYIFQGGKESVRRQVGMAVPPEGARIVFQKVLSTIVNYYYPEAFE